MPLQKPFHTRHKLLKVQLLQRPNDILGNNGGPPSLTCDVIGAGGEVEDENSGGAGEGAEGVFGDVGGFGEGLFEEAADAGCGGFKVGGGGGS